MSYFSDLENTAYEILINADVMNAGQYRFDPGENNVNDGFNNEYKRGEAYLRACRIAIARGTGESTANNTTHIGTVNQTDVAIGDVFAVVNPRNQIRKYTVTAFKPTEQHTLLDLAEVRDVA